MKVSKSLSSFSSAVCACLFMLFGEIANAAPIITNFSYDLGALTEAELLNDWNGIGDGTRSGINIDSNLFYTRNDIALGDGEAFLLEALMSAPAVGAIGERGARLSVKFFDADSPDIPPPPFEKLRHIEVRLQEDGAGSRWFSLVDATDGTEKASLYYDWNETNPRNTVRIRRQLIGTDSFLFLEAGQSNGTLTSTQVLLSSFGVTTGADSELAFGNILSGTYSSSWETVRVMRSNEADTLLPQVPIPPTVWLFGSGLLGLVGAARRKKV